MTINNDLTQLELESPCPCCSGRGWDWYDRERCEMCNGAGHVPTGFGEKVLALIRHNISAMISEL